MKQVLGVLAFLALFAGGWYGYYLYETTGRPYGHYEMDSEVLHFGMNKVTWRNYPSLNQPPIDANGNFTVNEDGHYVARFQRLIDPPRWAVNKNARFYEEVLYTLSYNKEQDTLQLVKITVNIKRNITVKKTQNVRVTGNKIFVKQEQK